MKKKPADFIAKEQKGQALGEGAGVQLTIPVHEGASRAESSWRKRAKRGALIIVMGFGAHYATIIKKTPPPKKKKKKKKKSIYIYIYGSYEGPYIKALWGLPA